MCGHHVWASLMCGHFCQASPLRACQKGVHFTLLDQSAVLTGLFILSARMCCLYCWQCAGRACATQCVACLPSCIHQASPLRAWCRVRITLLTLPSLRCLICSAVYAVCLRHCLGLHPVCVWIVQRAFKLMHHCAAGQLQWKAHSMCHSVP
jgi:hypothetical protein